LDLFSHEVNDWLFIINSIIEGLSYNFGCWRPSRPSSLALSKGNWGKLQIMLAPLVLSSDLAFLHCYTFEALPWQKGSTFPSIHFTLAIPLPQRLAGVYLLLA